MIAQNYDQYLNNLLQPLLQPGSAINLPYLVENVGNKTEQLARDYIKQYLEDMDSRFRLSIDRANNYYVKDTRERTIITMFGEIKYKRTIYTDRNTNKPYCYVDDKMSINRYIRYGNDVASYAYESYSNENSMIKVWEELGKLIHGKFFLNKENIDYSLSRATIYNLIKRIKETRFQSDNKIDCENLYILADEKYIPCCLENSNKMMVKAVLFTQGLNKDNPSRPYYINPYYFSQYNGDFTTEVLNIIESRYKLSSIKKIHVLSDGGGWIKALKRDIRFDKIKTINYLDYFHFSRSLYRIVKDSKKYKLLISQLKDNKKEEVKKALLNSDEKDKKESDIKYIISNLKSIVNTLTLTDMNCAAEQMISHHLASQFTSVAKAYSPNNINRYLSQRDNFRNKENMKLTFLTSLDKQKDDNNNKVILNKQEFDYSIFDKKSNEHQYDISSSTSKKLQFNMR